MKMRGSEKKKMNKNKYDISSIKRVTRKFLVVSPHVVVDVQINGKEMYKKKSVLHVLHRLAIRNYIFCLSKL